MSVPYDLIITSARETYLPTFFSANVHYEYNGEMAFSVAWSMNQGDDMVHLHSVKGHSLTEVIEEARRRCEWENGRSDEKPVEIGDQISVKRKGFGGRTGAAS